MSERSERPSRRACILALVGTAAAMVLALPASAAAQSVERITRYDVELVVEDDGDLLVTETIDYDFGSNERHGIFRDIPVRFDFDDRNERIYPIDDISVEGSPGTPDEFERTSEGRILRLKIGDPDETITGEHTYEIRYRVEGALNGFDDHDELFWNAVGTEWLPGIDSITATVVTPGDVTEVACFAGPLRSTLPCDSAVASGDRATFTTAGLAPFEGLTVVVGFPTGLVPAPEPVLDERWSLTRAFEVTPATAAGSGGLLAAVVGGISLLTWRRGRDRQYAGSPTDAAFGNDDGAEHPVPLGGVKAIPVEFVPPDGLRPGQVGTLVDEVAHPLDVTATIIDLAVRGYLRIEELPDTGFFKSKTDYRLVRLPPADGLLPYEATLLGALFASGGDILLSSLRNTFATKMAGVQNALYDDAVTRGWFPRRPDKVRGHWIGLGVLALLLGFAAVVVAAAFTHLALLAVPLLIGGVLLLVLAGKMPHRTAKGTGVLRRALGFRRFIEDSEASRAQFAERAHLFTEYLPYAVVFGATERWARAFEGLGGQLPVQTWYVGPHPFTPYGFSQSLNDFSVQSAGTLVSSPSSSGSSGFSGGGFSGGGGGGGGGGSW